MNISTLAELIQEFLEAEKTILNQQNIKHPTTIGAMFEGLTAEVLNKSVFEGLGLKVIKNSFINGCDTEFDVLLVEGEGEQIPHTDRYKYKPEQVIAVIQVKKNLYSQDIEDGYNNLKFILDYYENTTPEKFVGYMFRNSFKEICRKDILTLKKEDLSENEKAIYDVLWIEAKLPVRIIWGYNGFANEYNFRNSFCNYLSEKRTTDFNNKIGGFGPHNFPNQIICGQYSMLKNCAMPFIARVGKDNWWPFYVSSSYNPTYFFLELIWTRLSYKFEEIPGSIFGEDLSMEPASPFLDCRVQTLDGQNGWEYNNTVISDKNLKANTQVLEWQPVELDFTQHYIIALLCKLGEIDLNTDKEFEPYILKQGYPSLVDFFEKLTATNLVYIESGKLRLLTELCRCCIVDGKYFAGDDKSGRLTNWVLKEIAKSKEGNQ